MTSRHLSLMQFKSVATFPLCSFANDVIKGRREPEVYFNLTCCLRLSYIDYVDTIVTQFESVVYFLFYVLPMTQQGSSKPDVSGIANFLLLLLPSRFSICCVWKPKTYLFSLKQCFLYWHVLYIPASFGAIEFDTRAIKR